MTAYAGLFHVLVTPFDEDGAVDADALRRVVEFALAAGASGLTALGVNGEAAFLDERERALVVDTAIEAAAGRAPVVVGVSSPDARVAAVRAAAAERAGAGAVMLAVPPRAELLDAHLAAVAAAAPGLELVLQDYPPSGHEPVSAEALAAAVRAQPAIRAVKAEDPPTPAKVAALGALAPGVARLGGLGSLWLLWELRAGAEGTMTGFAFPALLARIVAAAAAGDWEEAENRYQHALPALVWEAQPVVGLALRKLVLVERGIIPCARLRQPVPSAPGGREQARAFVTAMQDAEVRG
jgi:4-hydroxy-tetrahydrodipicolinate synthase